MWMTKLKVSAAFLIAAGTVTGGGLPAQQAQAPMPDIEAKAKPDSAEMAQIEANLAKLRELIRAQPGEYATNLAKIAWERDPWAAAVRAAKEGKPVLAYGVQSVGVTGGYG
jgi:hypothetical protein